MKATTDPETYRCPKCQAEQSIQRARGYKVAIGHKKMLYCVRCKMRTNHMKVSE